MFISIESELLNVVRNDIKKYDYDVVYVYICNMYEDNKRIFGIRFKDIMFSKYFDRALKEMLLGLYRYDFMTCVNKCVCMIDIDKEKVELLLCFMFIWFEFLDGGKRYINISDIEE